jgi:hypothetical protein
MQPSFSIMGAAQTASSFVRFFFYLFGMLLFAGLGYLLLKGWNLRPQFLGVQPSFSIAATPLDGLSATSRVTTAYGARIEMRQYGQPHDRNVDLTANLVLPNPSEPAHPRIRAQDITEIQNPFRGAYASSTAHYDLETRFGAIRAFEFTASTDGRAKLCIAWRSRFDTSAFFLNGWYCEASGARPSFQALACILDKLTLDRDLPSQDANAFLRERMKRSARCVAEPVSQTVDTRTRTHAPAPGLPYSTRLPPVRR